MNAKITLVELAELMAESSSTTVKVCELFLRELFATISQSLIDGESVKVKGIGTFKITHVKPRKSVNVSSGEAIQLTAHNKLSFTPDKSFADAVNQPFAQFETVFLDDAVTEEKLAEIDRQYPSLFDENETDEPQPVVATAAALPIAEEPVEEVPSELSENSENSEISEPGAVEEKSERRVGPAMAIPIDGPGLGQDLTEQQPTESEALPESKPLLVGVPITGPSQPVPEPEPEEATAAGDYFYRPELRNAYMPTAEQIEEASRKPNKRWLWLAILLGVLAAGLLTWFLTRGGGDGKTEAKAEQVVVAADTLTAEQVKQIEKSEEAKKSKAEAEEKKIAAAVEKKEEVVKSDQPDKSETTAEETTDVVTSQIVLTTLAEKYYGSQWFWVYIYEENLKRGIINDPNNIRPGTRVVIPPASKYGIDPKDKAALRKAQIKSMEYLSGK